MLSSSYPFLSNHCRNVLELLWNFCQIIVFCRSSVLICWIIAELFSKCCWIDVEFISNHRHFVEILSNHRTGIHFSSKCCRIVIEFMSNCRIFIDLFKYSRSLELLWMTIYTVNRYNNIIRTCGNLVKLVSKEF